MTSKKKERKKKNENHRGGNCPPCRHPPGAATVYMYLDIKSTELSFSDFCYYAPYIQIWRIDSSPKAEPEECLDDHQGNIQWGWPVHCGQRWRADPTLNRTLWLGALGQLWLCEHDGQIRWTCQGILLSGDRLSSAYSTLKLKIYTLCLPWYINMFDLFLLGSGTCEEFKCKNWYIHFYQFEIFVINPLKTIWFCHNAHFP